MTSTDASTPFDAALNLADLHPGIVHGFFGRRGGVSNGDYRSLNAGVGSDDDPECVAENLRLIAGMLGAPTAPVLSAYQIHSPRAVEVTATFDRDRRPEADALVTRRPNLLLCALAADCTPLLLADPEAGLVASVHAGWRGAAGGVIEAALELMVRLGGSLNRLQIAIGPCIGASVYEVGPDHRAAILDQDAEADGFYAPGDGDRLLFDLPGYCAARLARAGANAPWVSPVCTLSSPETHFSYRYQTKAGRERYGRNASVIGLAL